jgi:hypothetical protein
VTDSDASGKLQDFASVVDPSVLQRAKIKAIHIYDNPDDAEEGIRLLVASRIDVPEGARGVFDRETRTLVATHWAENEESGKVFYHELGHASEHFITDARWETPWSTEWSDADQDEGFAHAFADYHVAKYETAHPEKTTGWLAEERKKESAMQEFARMKPLTYELFKRWGL